MASLGYVPFGRNVYWWVATFEKRFWKETVEAYQVDPTLTPGQLLDRLLAEFQPKPLFIFPPTDTRISWEARTGTARGVIAKYYLHEAVVQYRGTKELWRLRGPDRGRFETVLKIGKKVTFRMLRPEPESGPFREFMIGELERAREAAASQERLHRKIEWEMSGAIERFFNAVSLDELRTHGIEKREANDRASQYLNER